MYYDGENGGGGGGGTGRGVSRICIKKANNKKKQALQGTSANLIA